MLLALKPFHTGWAATLFSHNSTRDWKQDFVNFLWRFRYNLSDISAYGTG